VLDPAGAVAGQAVPPAAPARIPASLRFRVARIGPWSAFKLSLLFATGTAIVVLAGLAVLYVSLDAAGILGNIEKVVNQYGVGNNFHFDAGWIFTRLAWIAAFMVVMGALVATCLTAFYNALSDVTGGLDVTLEPRDREQQQQQPVRSEPQRPARRGRRPQRHQPRQPRQRREGSVAGQTRAAVVGAPRRRPQDEDLGTASGF
jgi:Transmembrane domain of unknown function (DUF3566)